MISVGLQHSLASSPIILLAPMISRAETEEQKAIKEAKQLIHISPKEAPKLLAGLARSYRAEGKIGSALQARRYQCFALMGNLEYSKARECLEELFAEANEANERRFVGIGEMYLGIMATENGEVDTAAECFDHAIHIGTELQDLDLIHRVQVNLGFAQLMMERYEEALESFRLIARYYESGGSAADSAAAYANIAFAQTHIAYRALVNDELTEAHLNQAKKSLDAALVATRDDFRLETLTNLLHALYTGIQRGPEAGLKELESAKDSVFQRAALSISIFYMVIECKLYELAKDWQNLRRTATNLLKVMRKYHSLSQFQTVYRQAARAHAEEGDFKSAYRLLQESSAYLMSARNAAGLHGAHIMNLRYSLENREFDQAILKIRNRNLVERNRVLEQEARLDPLSGVLNRRGIEEAMMEYAEKRSVRKFAIALLDIDLFKRINDAYGHAVGDRVITEFATCLTKSRANPAKIGRWGGEEFMVLFDIDEAQEMESLGETLIDEIRRYPWFKTHKGLKVTASCGLALWRLGDSLDEITEQADQMLYAVKQNGRNGWRVASYDHAA